MMKFLKILITLIGSITCLYSQHNNNWKFGSYTGLNFNTPVPTLSVGQSGSYDYTSTMSDNNGALLFYTDGITVWDKNNNVMPNGSGLIGSFTAGQCALIVPVPCSQSKYVIFHVTDYGNPGYLHYTVVDMNLNSGLGDVVFSQKNILLGIGWTEKLCAYYNPAGNYYWVLTHKWLSNQFVAYKVDANTIATTSVVSAIGSVHNSGSVGGTHDAMGQLTISQDGLKVVNAITDQDKFEYFDFNVNTGVLSNSMTLTGDGGKAWGTAFSPDSKKLYVSSIFGSNTYQFDLVSNNQSTIQSSKTSIYNTMAGGYSFGYLELGPDGKIYMPRPNTSTLSVIGNPNGLPATCGFTYSGLQVGTASLKWGLSRIAYNIPSNTSPVIPLSASVSSLSCYMNSTGAATVTPQYSGNYSYLWLPGNYTTSVATNLSAGLYSVQVSDNVCGSNTIVVNVTQPASLNLIVSDPQEICREQSAVLSSTLSGGTPVYTYTWSNGSNFSGANVSPVNSTQFSLTVTDAHGCTTSATTSVTVLVCTGVSLENNDHVKTEIYPNPSSDYIHLKTNEHIEKIECYDLNGRLLKVITLENGTKIPVTDLESGMYVLQIYFEYGVHEKHKFVKIQNVE